MEKKPKTDRTKRQPRDPGATRKRGWNPADDVYGDKSQKAVDTDLDLDGKYETPAKP